VSWFITNTLIYCGALIRELIAQTLIHPNICKLIKFTVDREGMKTHNKRLSKAPVAQLDRVHGYEPCGREFESLRARHTEINYSPVAQSVERMTVNH
jgi:hypothetical protein